MAASVPQFFAALMPFEERLRVAIERPHHSDRDRIPILGNGDHVDVVPHERIGPDFEAGISGRILHRGQELYPVLVIEKYVLS
jgi:hypothetical protein